MQANFRRCSAGKIRENSVCGRPQAVLAIPEMECKRGLVCTGRLPKTNTGGNAYTDKKILKKFW